MIFHCYMEFREAVHTWDGEAGNAEQAAARAAEKHGLQGRWAVVAGHVTYVDVAERKAYIGTAAPPEAQEA